jgi:hypothetical protein
MGIDGFPKTICAPKVRRFVSSAFTQKATAVLFGMYQLQMFAWSISVT